ncbi:Olah [Symbiodinium pilosum]|uniref:Olah protein n=1 Tax=Symbiodinium pilosum TaxID=2952 RepID=A0A812UD04_SYMPI|nr:Olah [Symbiodinium pilosum]
MQQSPDGRLDHVVEKKKAMAKAALRRRGSTVTLQAVFELQTRWVSVFINDTAGGQTCDVTSFCPVILTEDQCQHFSSLPNLFTQCSYGQLLYQVPGKPQDRFSKFNFPMLVWPSFESHIQSPTPGERTSVYACYAEMAEMESMPFEHPANDRARRQPKLELSRQVVEAVIWARLFNRFVLGLVYVALCVTQALEQKQVAMQARGWVEKQAKLLGHLADGLEWFTLFETASDWIESCTTTATKQSILPPIREAAAEMGCLDEWRGSTSAISAACEMEQEDAETLLAKGFGWSTWLAVNRAEYLKPEVPRPSQVAESLRWLASGPLTLTPAELRAVIQGSPKASLRNPAASYEDALATAPEEFQHPSAFRQLLVRCPIVLEPWKNYRCCASEPFFEYFLIFLDWISGTGKSKELSFHCGHSCAAACSRCWCPAMHRVKKAKESCSFVAAIRYLGSIAAAQAVGEKLEDAETISVLSSAGVSARIAKTGEQPHWRSFAQCVLEACGLQLPEDGEYVCGTAVIQAVSFLRKMRHLDKQSIWLPDVRWFVCQGVAAKTANEGFTAAKAMLHGAEDKQVIIAALAGAVNIAQISALAVSLQGTPSGLDGVQDPALVRNILRTLIRMVAFEDCPTRFVESQHTSSELMRHPTARVFRCHIPMATTLSVELDPIPIGRGAVKIFVEGRNRRWDILSASVRYFVAGDVAALFNKSMQMKARRRFTTTTMCPPFYGCLRSVRLARPRPQ